MLHQPSSTFQPSAVLPLPEGDAALIALGAELRVAMRAAFAASKAVDDADGSQGELLDALIATSDAASNIENALIRKIEVLPARTFEGLRVKAMAFHACRCQEPINDEFFKDLFDWDGSETLTTDLRLTAGILRDLLTAPAAEAASR